MPRNLDLSALRSFVTVAEVGGVTRAATQWNGLCRGNLDRMVTDTKMLLIEGMKLAAATFHAARQALGWAVEEIDEFVIHQVSRVHTDALVKTVGIDPRKVFTIFREHGNIGPASVPIVLSKLKEMGRLRKGRDASEATLAVLTQQLARIEALAADESNCLLQSAVDA